MSARLVPLANVDADLAERWRRLGDESLEPNPFVGADFVLPAARWVAAGAPLAVVIVERGRDVLFALPVTLRPQVLGIPVRAVGTWLHPYSYLGTPLVSRKDPIGAWEEVIDVLTTVAPWAVFRLFSSDGSTAAALDSVSDRRRRSLGVLHRPSRPVVRRRPQPTYLAETISGKGRKDLRRLRRRLGEQLGGDLACVDYAVPGCDLDWAVKGFLEMEAEGWKGRDGGAMACHSGHGDFFAEICRRFAAAGRLQLWALEAAGRPVAYQCNLLGGNTLFQFKVAFDEALGRYSPGLQLDLDLVDEFHSDCRLDMIDSCVGATPTFSHQIYPDRRELADLVLPLHGLLGHGVARAAPHARAAYRRAKKLRRSVAKGT